MSEKAKDDKPKMTAIPNPPPNCGTWGCGKQWHQLAVKVRNRAGAELTNSFSQFGLMKNSVYLLRPEFEFVCWLAICVDCMYERLERNNKQQLKINAAKYTSKSVESA